MNAADAVKLLLIECDDGKAKLVRRAFERVQSVFPSSLEHVSTLEEGLDRLGDDALSVVMLDPILPDGQGLRPIQQVAAKAGSSTIIVLSAVDDEALAAEALAAGAHEILIKTQVDVLLLPKVVRSAIERNRLERELHKARAELFERIDRRTDELERIHNRILQAERLAAVGATITGIAHESRNALQKIQAAVNRLRRRLNAEETDAFQFLDEIEMSADQVRGLFEEVRSYASPMVLNTESADLREIWREAWRRALQGNRFHNARLSEANEHATEARALIDSARMSQVFSHIFANSLAARENDLEVIIDAQLVHGLGQSGLEISVSDNGPGLGGEQQDRIFEPFYTTKRSGRGLGMAIVKRIIDAHGGSIRVSGNDQSGTEVVFWLPLTPIGSLEE